MSWLRVLLLAAASAWIAGNCALVMLAPRVFSFSPSKGGDGAIVDHQAAGAVYGALLATWSSAVTVSLLPALALGAVGCALAARSRGRNGGFALYLAAAAIAVGAHLWSASVIERSNTLLAQLRATRTYGERAGEFNALHRQSYAAMTSETIAALALALAAAAALGRGASAPPAGR